MTKLRPIFYDTETTGLKADRDRIIEIAAYDPYQDKTFHSLINPSCKIPRDATAIHKITDEMVADAPLFAEMCPTWNQFCAGDVVLIAHNNDSFDQHFLQHEYSRNGLTMPSWKFLDSLKWARRYRPDLPSHSLQYLREIYKIPPNNAHRALDDVRVLHQIFIKLTDDLSLEEILTLFNQSRQLQHMPFGKHQGIPLKNVPSSYVQWLSSTGAFDKPENAQLKSMFQQLGKL